MATTLLGASPRIQVRILPILPEIPGEIVGNLARPKSRVRLAGSHHGIWLETVLVKVKPCGPSRLHAIESFSDFDQ